MNFAQRFTEEFQKELKERMFPSEELPSQWLANAREALLFASPLSLGCPPEDLAGLIKLDTCGAQINLFDFAVLSNNLEARTAKELGLSLEDYALLMQHVSIASKRWNELTSELRSEVTKRVNEELQMKGASEKGASEKGAGGNPLKPIIGEA